MIRALGVKAALEVQVSDDEAVELAALAQAGDLTARDRLAHSFMGLAMRLVNAYARQLSQVDEAELQGAAFEALLRYGIDRYSPEFGLPVRVWVGLVLRRRLADVVRLTLQRLEREHEMVHHATVTRMETTPPMDEDPGLQLDCMLTWAVRSDRLTTLQSDCVRLRAQGMNVQLIGDVLGIGRKRVAREIKVATAILQEDK